MTKRADCENSIQRIGEVVPAVRSSEEYNAAPILDDILELWIVQSKNVGLLRDQTAHRMYNKDDGNLAQIRRICLLVYFQLKQKISGKVGDV